MSVVYYEGERIYFRPVEAEDIPLLCRWVNDPRNWATLGQRRPMSAAAETEWLERISRSTTDYLFGIVVREQHQLIGTCGLHAINPVDRRAVMGMMIGACDMQNNGYGSEATQLVVRFGFEELNLHRIELAVFASNARGIRAYEKAGFVLEGRHREAIHRNGRYHDELRYAVLRDEWEAAACAGADTRGAAKAVSGSEASS